MKLNYKQKMQDQQITDEIIRQSRAIISESDTLLKDIAKDIGICKKAIDT